MRKLLLQVSAAVEVGAGAALAAVPSMFVGLLIGGTLDSPTALVVARLAGAALVTLGLICGFASRDSETPAAAGIARAFLFYNVAAVGVLLYARLGADLSGPVTWPAIAMHATLAVWCLACAR